MLDWAPAGGDADAYDLDGKDPGTEYAFMQVPLRHIQRTSTKKEPETNPGGSNYIKALGYYDDRMQITGWVVDPTGSFANTVGYLSYWTELVGNKTTDDGDMYLVIQYANGLFYPFWDTDSEVIREYCRGTFIDNDLLIKKVMNNPMMYEVSFGWFAHW